MNKELVDRLVKLPPAYCPPMFREEMTFRTEDGQIRWNEKALRDSSQAYRRLNDLFTMVSNSISLKESGIM